MTMRTNYCALLLGGLLAASCLTGCEDSAARTRAEVQVTIENASRLFRDASYADTNQKRSQLNRVVSDLSPLNDGEPGQQAAKALLLADALRELAAMNLQQAETLQMEHHRKRQIIRTNISSMAGLESHAAALTKLTTQPQRIAFQRDREQLERQVREVDQRIAELSTPITDLTSRNDADMGEVQRLRDEANELLRRATDMGFADGFPSFEESVALRRQADRIEKRVSERDVDLSHDLKPKHAQATMQAESLKSMLEATRTTLRQLDEYDRLYEANIASLRQNAEELRRDIMDGIRNLNQSASSDLDPLYDQAATQLERAATQARQAAQRLRGDAGAARVMEARCQEMLGRTHWSQARGLTDHIMLLTSLVTAAPTASGLDGLAAQLQTIVPRQQQLLEQARTAYTEAQTALDAVPGAVPGVDAYRNNLQIVLAMLTGQPIMPDAPPSPADLSIEMPDMPDMPQIPEMPDLSDLPFDPSALDQMPVIEGREALLSIVDSMTFEAAKPMFQAVGMSDPAQLEQMREPYTKALANVRARVENGEITNSIQLNEAMMEEMMKQMTGGGR